MACSERIDAGVFSRSRPTELASAEDLKRRFSFIVLAALACIVLMGYAGETLAHASLAKSDPPSRGALAQAPAELRLWFSEQIEPGYAQLSVQDEHESTLVAGKGTVSKDDSRLVTLKLHPLAPGKYTVRYKVLSVVGHAVNSSYVFSIKPTSGDR